MLCAPVWEVLICTKYNENRYEKSNNALTVVVTLIYIYPVATTFNPTIISYYSCASHDAWKREKLEPPKWTKSHIL